jgi:predicted DNA-binding transcriptional regulator AlpA
MILQFPARKSAHQDTKYTSIDRTDPYLAGNIKLHRRITPRGLSRTEAAAYIGVSPCLFDQLVKDGRMPHPIRINARTVWDRKKVDEAFEALQDNDCQENPWDDVANGQ